MSKVPASAVPRGVLARLRHHIGPRLPKTLRRAAARLLKPLEARRGAVYEVAGQRLRFVAGSEPVVVLAATDERQRLDALQLNFFANAIRPGDVVADVGAYRGTYTLVAAARVGARGRVVAFEPTTTNASVIKLNATINKLRDRVDVENIAVSDTTGTATLFADGDSSGNSLWTKPAKAREVIVQTTSLDDYFRGQQLPHVLKIDVEGGELAVLRGAHSILESRAVIICELHPYAWGAAGVAAEDLRVLLAQYDRVAIDIMSKQEIEDFGYGVVLLDRRG